MADFALTPTEDAAEDAVEDLAADALARQRLKRILATRTPEQLLETQRRVRLMHQIRRERDPGACGEWVDAGKVKARKGKRWAR